ncbi:MAG: hypothetical protein RH942_01345 [Kiloniellaceae bacterium]
MELLGTLKVPTDEIRKLAIYCYALDIAAYHLFVDGTHEDKSGRTKSIYGEQLSRQLLNLAIALRTKFYQGYNHIDTARYVTQCGFLDKKKQEAGVTVQFSIKDVCDKIIHSDRVMRQMEKGVEKPTTTFQGRDGRDKSDWELSMSVSLFTEAVLNWVQDVEGNDEGSALESATT